MKCPNCGTENVPDARFCLHCGQKLTSELTCPNCHAVVLPGAAFCSQCGQPLAPAAQPAAGLPLVPAPTATPVPTAAPAPAVAPAPEAAPAPAVAPAPEAVQTPVVPPAVTSASIDAAAPGVQPPPGGGPEVIQTSTGDNNIQVNISNVHGSEVNLTVKPVERPKALPQPLELRPLAFPDLLDRQDELLEVGQSLEQRAPVEISGEVGEGRTSLMRAVGNSPSADLKRFPGGVVYHRALGQPVTDVLQSLFALFYELPQDYKPSPEEIHRGLHDLQALVLLDDVSLTSDQLTDLRSQTPNATFVLVTSERTLRGEGRALALGGLPTEAALALIERELGRPLASQERAAASQLCASLKGNPDRLLKTAARVRKGQTFDSILQSMAQTPLNPILLSGLTAPEMRVVSVVALGRGAPLPLEHIAPLADLPDAAPALQSLQGRRLAGSNSPSYSLTGALAQELWRDWDLSQWARRALDYFIQWAEARQDEPRRIFDSIDVILSLLEWAVGQKHWAQVLRLGRAIQAALALSLRWGAWLQVLTWILAAARSLGERSAEGWALHQIGTLALCVSDHQAARSFLAQALALRQSIGDRAGAAVTQHNLNLLLGPLAPPSKGKPPPTKGPSTPLSSAGGLLKWILPLLGGTILVAAAVAIGIWHPWVQSTPTPTMTLPPQTPTWTPTPTITPTGPPPADIEFSVQGGCDHPYPPGSGQVFSYRTSQDGFVTVLLDGEALPDPNQKPVVGGVQYAGKFVIPRQPGDHVLTAVFDTGITLIQRECPFTVPQSITPPPPPVLTLRIEPGKCGARYVAGDPIGIHVIANRDGQVDFTLHPNWLTADTWNPIGDNSSLGVTADQEAALAWSAPSTAGRYTLRASLNQGIAIATCDLEVFERNPPTIQGITLAPQLPCGSQVVEATVKVMDDTEIGKVDLYAVSPDTGNFEPVRGEKIDANTYQFRFFASIEVGTQFYLEVSDVFGNVLSTKGNPNQAWSGFTETGVDYEEYCVAFLILPQLGLPEMDFRDMPVKVGSWFDCLTQCNDYTGCAAFTFDASTDSCWLKTGVPPGVPWDVGTSGIKFMVRVPATPIVIP